MYPSGETLETIFFTVVLAGIRSCSQYTGNAFRVSAQGAGGSRQVTFHRNMGVWETFGEGICYDACLFGRAAGAIEIKFGDGVFFRQLREKVFCYLPAYFFGGKIKRIDAGSLDYPVIRLAVADAPIGFGGTTVCYYNHGYWLMVIVYAKI